MSGIVEGKRWVMGRKEAGRSCLLNHITIKGIALTLSPLCALSIPTNLLIDRCSSQTVPLIPASRAPKVPWARLMALRAATESPENNWLFRRQANKNLPCRAHNNMFCLWIHDEAGGEQIVFSVGLTGCAALAWKWRFPRKTVASHNISWEKTFYSFHFKLLIAASVQL